MSDLLRKHADVQPEAPALFTPSRLWTYADLDAAVAATQARLQDEVVDSGMRVGIHLPRSANTVVLIWALWRLGAVAVPLSTRLPAAQVAAQARQVGAEILIADKRDLRTQSSDTLSVLPPEQVVREGGGAASVEPGKHPRDRPATIIFTSGSTGTPKAALHSWDNHLYSAKGANANVPLRRDDRWLLSLPLYHVGGLAILVRCALAGAAVALPDPEVSLADAVVATGATHLSLVATQFRRILEKTEGGPPSHLRAVLLGGGPVPEDLIREGVERGWPLHTTYGCTEMASQVSTTAPGAPDDDLQTAGRRLPHRRVRIDDGHILVAGAPLFRGYVTADGLEDPRTEDGWYSTGDRGRLDASGRLHVQGRLDRTFISGGENVQPEEIETVIEGLEGVVRALVVPVPDAEYGQRPIAFLRTEHALSDLGLERALEPLLPRFKIPDAFHVLPDEAMTDSLKVDREYLRKKARMLHDQGAAGMDDL